MVTKRPTLQIKADAPERDPRRKSVRPGAPRAQASVSDSDRILPPQRPRSLPPHPNDAPPLRGAGGPRGDRGDRAPRPYGDRPDRGGFGDKPRGGGYGDKPRGSSGDRPRGDGYGDKPRGGFGDRPQGSGYGDRPRGDRYGEKPRGNFGDKPRGSFGDHPQGQGREGGPRDAYPRPNRGTDHRDGPRNDRPPQGFGDRPARRDEGGYRNERPGPRQDDRQDRPRGDFPRPDRGGFGAQREGYGRGDDRARPPRDDRPYGPRPGFGGDRGPGGGYGREDHGNRGTQGGWPQQRDARPAQGPRPVWDDRPAEGPRHRDDDRRPPGGGFDERRPRPPAHAEGRPPRQDHRRLQRPHDGDGAPNERPAPRDLHTADNAAGIRLAKVLSDRGSASRREADDWISAGWVKVDGQMAVLGQRVTPDQVIEIDPAATNNQAKQVTILLHKPVGYVSGQAEDGYEPAAVLVRPENRWEEDRSRQQFHPGQLRGLAPAGRLDIDSTGLLVLTQDGRIARFLIGEQSPVEKEYLVRVEHLNEGPFPEESLKLLNHGLSLDGVELRPARVSWQNEDQLRFVLREGRKRQIRRMCELVGLKVVGLKRVRIGSVVLGKLPAGQWRYLAEGELF